MDSMGEALCNLEIYIAKVEWFFYGFMSATIIALIISWWVVRRLSQ